jgi:hypothetical protein
VGTLWKYTEKERENILEKFVIGYEGEISIDLTAKSNK